MRLPGLDRFGLGNNVSKQARWWRLPAGEFSSASLACMSSNHSDLGLCGPPELSELPTGGLAELCASCATCVAVSTPQSHALNAFARHGGGLAVPAHPQQPREDPIVRTSG